MSIWAVEELEKSEKLLKKIFDTIPDAIIQTDMNFNILSCNQSVKRILGYTPKELVGENYTIIVPEEMFKDLNQKSRQATLFEEGHLEINDFYFKKKSGEKFPATFSVSLIEGKDGEPEGLIGTIHDISGRVDTHEKLRKSQKHLKGIIENSGDAIVTTNLEGKITLWSKGSEELYGYKTEEVIDKTIDFLYPEELKEERRTWQKKILAGEIIRNLRTRIFNSSGNLVDINLTLSPMYDEDGNPCGTVGISKDISGVVEAEKKLHDKIEELEKWQSLTINREIKMVELKKEIRELKEKSRKI
jgi:PAS domain S-box-containing protein